MPRAAARGRRPDLSAYARQPARGPTMVAVVAGVCVVVVAGTKVGASVVGGGSVVLRGALVVVAGWWVSVGWRRAFVRRSCV